MELLKFPQRKKTQRLVQTAENYRSRVKVLQKKMLSAIKNYKQAVDAERMDVAKKRINKNLQ